ncbi:MAG: diguanylate cyclase [Myxococcota bacterium]
MSSNAGLLPQVVEDFGGVVEALRAGTPVALIAFDALKPDPQKLLRTLRTVAPEAALIATYGDDNPRIRLGHRLWSAGLLDFFVSRVKPMEVVRPALRQAWAEVMTRASLPRFGDGTLEPTQKAMHALMSLGTALANHDDIDGILRELQRRLPGFIDYEVLTALIITPHTPHFYTFQQNPVSHETMWMCAQEMCRVANSVTRDAIEVQHLKFVELAPITRGEPRAAPAVAHTRTDAIVVPLLFCGELVGCLGVLTPSVDPKALSDIREKLLVVAQHVATSLRHSQVVATLRAASNRDPLTGLVNRRHMTTVLITEQARARRYNLNLTVCIVDIDYFKRVNDSLGHLVGDEVLIRFSERLQQHLRRTDVLCRFGGEEFLFILPETDLRGAVNLMERIRLSLRTDPIKPRSSDVLSIDFSGGIAAMPSQGTTTGEELIAQADEALLRAKRNGRGRIEVANAELDEAGNTGPEQRRAPRMRCELPATFVPLRDFNLDSKMRINTIDVSAGGAALTTGVTHLTRNSYGLVFLDERQSPYLARVAWSRRVGMRAFAGVEFVRDSGGLRASGHTDLESVIVLTSRPETLNVARRVLLSYRHDLEIIDGVRQPPNAHQRDKASLVIIGESMLRENIAINLVEENSRRANPMRVVVVHEDSTRQDVLQTIADMKVRYFVPSDGNSEEGLFATLNKLLSGRIFGVTRYLLPAADVQRWIITNTEQKDAVLEGVKRFGVDIGSHPRIMDLLLAALDEMIINALYRTGGPSEARPVGVECGADGRMLAAGVIDEHGLLDPRAVFEGLSTAMRHQREGIPEGSPSAKLGFRIMLESLSNVVINVDPNHRTEIIGMIDLRRTLREHRSAPPGFGIFDAG